MRVEDPPRFALLEACATAPAFSPADAWQAPGGREAARAALAASLRTEVTSVPPGRLLALLGQALKWQQHTGALPPGDSFDLFRGAPPPVRAAQDAAPVGAWLARLCARPSDARLGAVEVKTVRFGKKSHAEVARFSPDGLVRAACLISQLFPAS